jgi:lipid A ethanolaminephosphotransferase
MMAERLAWTIPCNAALAKQRESLGEYGLYLHGTPYTIAPKFQTEVPFLVWMSDPFVQDRNLSGRKLNSLAEYSQGFVFHSVMGALGLQGGAYDGRFDVFADAPGDR